jgi:hypothetical protein
MGTAPLDYDSPWKEALERYFKGFMAFFFPTAHAGIDWTRGYEFLDKELQRVVRDAESGATLQEFLKRLSPAWNLVGRVHFNLAENRKDEQAPFAFLATYTSRLSAHGQAQHQPLGQALREYAGAANKERLLALLLPVQRAAERCAWLSR